MAMSKKDFIALADAIKLANEQAGMRMGTTASDMRSGVSWAAMFIADVCAESNPRFKRERWLSYIAGECGKSGGKVKA